MQVYFAPLESITGYVFRNVFEKYYGGIDRYFTPFITATDSKRLRNKEMRDILPENNQVGCLIPQIMSNRAEEFLRVAGQMAELGYDTVNLNLGCPARTVVSKGKGSGFLARTVALDRFLEEIYRECPLKISIKTRLGVDDPEEFPEIIDIYNQYPVEELKFLHRILPDLLFVALDGHDYLHLLTQHIDTLYLALQAVGSGHIVPKSRQMAVQLLVGLLLMLQAAHQSAAYAGNLRRVQG